MTCFPAPPGLPGVSRDSREFWGFCHACEDTDTPAANGRENQIIGKTGPSTS